MSIENLDAIFKPQSIAVIGASSEEGSVGYTIMNNLIGADSNRVVYPINPKRESVQRVHAFPNVSEVPKKVDLAIICTPAKTVPQIVRECGESGVKGIIIISAGFRELGDEGKKLEQQVQDARQQFGGMRIIGPNCLGIIVPELELNASFAATTPKPGRLAFISQSGALCTSVLDWAQKENVGFSYFISIGNQLDVDFADLIEYFQNDENTKATLLYIESIGDGEAFIRASREFSREKPIIAYKSGRFHESAKAAASHTGALAGEDRVYEAAFQKAGIVRVKEIDDLFETAELLASHYLPRGNQLAIITNAGGPGVMATDALIDCGGELAILSEDLKNKLDESLPAYWSHGNPIDILGDATPKRFAESVKTVLADDAIDAALVILTPQSMTDPTGTAKAINDLKLEKAVLAAWMGGNAVSEGIDILNNGNIPTYETPERAIDAFMYMYAYAKNLEIVKQEMEERSIRESLDRDALLDKFGDIFSNGSSTFTEIESKSILEGYGIPVTKTEKAGSAEDAANIAKKIGYPVVLKIYSHEITHKTDVGGVQLNLNSAEEVKSAFEEIVSNAKEKRPDAKIDGVTVQQMADIKDSFELILGAKRDPIFGPVIMIGPGGISVEVFQDRSLRLLPLNEKLARRMIEELQSWKILKGYRGKPGINVDRTVEMMIRFSYLIADFPDISEMDINPLMVNSKKAIAVDARLITKDSE